MQQFLSSYLSLKVNIRSGLAFVVMSLHQYCPSVGFLHDGCLYNVDKHSHNLNYVADVIGVVLLYSKIQCLIDHVRRGKCGRIFALFHLS